MSDSSQEIMPVQLEQELKQSYLDYAMSVIVGRALPDVRDGLKPVHRRVLYAMKVLGNDYNKPYKKSARVVGDVIGKYHPHGDTAVYDTIVRLAQDFTMRYVLVDGQGNFGSVDGDAAAAMRYTEVRMDRLAHSLLADLDKETVDFSYNYDETELIPDVLPTRVPNLLVNGSAGIAVGMATNIPPHNLGEVIDGLLALIDNPELTVDELMGYIPGPDFPTAGFINGRAGIMDAYRSGRGRVLIRARTTVEHDKKSGKDRIIVTELPYQVNKARLVERIAELVKEKKIDGIAELRDESDKEGLRVVIELRRGEVADVVLNNLFMQTQLQVSFGVNMVALVEGQPRVLNLKDVLEAFIKHRKEVVTRRTIYELRKARERAHILEGMAVALSNIDEVIALIKAARNPAEAKTRMLERRWSAGMVKSMVDVAEPELLRPQGLAEEFGLQGDTYRFSAAQVDAILELRLHRLTGLEQDKIINEFQDLIARISELIAILRDVNRLLEVICDELRAIREQYADARRTEIMASADDLNYEDLIAEEQLAVTLSYDGYVKAQPLAEFRAQRRGGRGKSATRMKAEDFIANLVVASTHDTLLCFSTKGKLYWVKGYEFPKAGRNSRGRPMNNLLPLESDEKITAMVAVNTFSETAYVFMATRAGVVKKVNLSHFSRPRKMGIYAIALDEQDTLMNVVITDGDQDIMLFSDAGKAIRFAESEVRPMGRGARGVNGMRLGSGVTLVALLATPPEQGVVLTVTERGYGKRTPVAEYRKTARGTSGVIAIATTARNGAVVSAVQVADNDDVMLMTSQGVLVRTKAAEIRETGRSAQGVTLINMGENERLVAAQAITCAEELGASAEDDQQNEPTLQE